MLPARPSRFPIRRWCRERSPAAQFAEFGRLADRLARRQVEIQAPKGRQAAPDPLNQVARGLRVFGERFAQDLARLLLHRAPAVRGADAQARLGALVEIADGDARPGYLHM